MRILLIEDDTALCELIAFHLEDEGYEVDVCHEGDDGLRWAEQQAHGLILLDRMLPVMDGISVLQCLRRRGITTPVLLLTALGTVEEKVEGLDAGADDYLSKPFVVEELLARVRAMCRRPQQLNQTGILQAGDLTFDTMCKTLRSTGGECRLSRRESEMAAVLLGNAGKTVPRMILLSKVWGPDAEVEESSLDSYIYFLRRHLRRIGSKQQIHTVRGVGYALGEQTDVS